MKLCELRVFNVNRTLDKYPLVTIDEGPVSQPDKLLFPHVKKSSQQFIEQLCEESLHLLTL